MSLVPSLRTCVRPLSGPQPSPLQALCIGLLCSAAITVSLGACVPAAAAGDSRNGAPLIAAPAQGAVSVQLWHDAAREAISATKPNQQAALRLLAYLARVQHDAAEALHAATAEPSEAAWAALFDRASADTLAALMPAQAAAFRRLAEALAATRTASDTAPADAIGAQAARRAIERASTDGFDTAWTGSVPEAADAWRSQLQPPRPPHLPALGAMRPFYLPSGDALRPAAPPAPASEAFASALSEVKSRATPANTEGLSRARRWEMTGGSLVAGFWDATAAGLARQAGLPGRETARVLALTMGATLDANIACHDAKYRFWTPRPSQADAAIRPLVGLPNHPSYPSNHSCDSTAAATVLGAIFPAHRERLDAMAAEAGESRIDGGIHYRFDVTAGEQIGRGAAQAALRSTPRQHVAAQR